MSANKTASAEETRRTAGQQDAQLPEHAAQQPPTPAEDAHAHWLAGVEVDEETLIRFGISPDLQDSAD
jgi:hypothetical protein